MKKSNNSEKTDFDHYADSYNQLLQKQLNFFDDYSYFSKYKVELIKKHIKHTPKRILEYGCGIGKNLPFLIQMFPKAKVYGCDISEKSLKMASETNPSVIFFSLNKEFSEQDFDLIFIAGVLHHVNPKLRTQVMKQIYRLLSKNGELFVFEHNPYNPVTRYLTSTCDFDKDAVLLSLTDLKEVLRTENFTLTKTQYVLFFPRFLSFLRALEPYLGFIPLGGQYFIQAKK